MYTTSIDIQTASSSLVQSSSAFSTGRVAHLPFRKANCLFVKKIVAFHVTDKCITDYTFHEFASHHFSEIDFKEVWKLDQTIASGSVKKNHAKPCLKRSCW